jgi:hypothetical protein
MNLPKIPHNIVRSARSSSVSSHSVGKQGVKYVLIIVSHVFSVVYAYSVLSTQIPCGLSASLDVIFQESVYFQPTPMSFPLHNCDVVHRLPSECEVFSSQIQPLLLIKASKRPKCDRRRQKKIKSSEGGLLPGSRECNQASGLALCFQLGAIVSELHIRHIAPMRVRCVQETKHFVWRNFA